MTAPRRRVLVTNDDGIEAPGLAALAGALAGEGHDVVVVASPDDRSGSGAAIGPASLWSDIVADRVELKGLESVPAYAVEGPPALGVIAGLLGAFGAVPDLVASGINPGPNLGQAVLHSGTVGAVLTAANFGSRGVAVSLESAGAENRPTAQAMAAAAVSWLAEAAVGTVLNVNVPDRPLAEIAGVRWARLSRSGIAEVAVTGIASGQVRVSVDWLPPAEVGARAGVGRPTPRPEDDTVLLAGGYVTVTPISGLGGERDSGAVKALARAAGCQ